MKRMFGLLIVALTVSLIGKTAFHRPSAEDQTSQTLAEAGDLCWDRAPVAADSSRVDDFNVLRKLAAEGGAMVDKGDVVPSEALIKQLQRDRCELDTSDAKTLKDGDNVYAHAKDSIVVVSSIYKCNKCDNWHATSASGFAISSGAVATNYHVVNTPDKRTLAVMTSDGHVTPVKSVLAASRSDDLAILEVETPNLRPLPIAPKPAEVGSSVGVISHPARHFYCYTSGVVSRYMKVRSKNRVVDGMAITADYARGSSGAPVLDSRGQVVGIVQSTDSVYYSVENGQQKNLQMVFKTCVPAARLLALIQPKAEEE